MNPILTKIEQATLAKVNPPPLQKAVVKMVDMGKHILYSPESRKLVMSQLNAPGELTHKIGEGVAKLLGMIIHASQGTLPPKVGVPAASILLCEVLDMVEKSGKAQITNDFVAKCMNEMGSSVMQLYGATPEKVQAMFSKAQAQGKLPKGAQQPSLVQSAQGVPA